jgi:hypothetical protein
MRKHSKIYGGGENNAWKSIQENLRSLKLMKNLDESADKYSIRITAIVFMIIFVLLMLVFPTIYVINVLQYNALGDPLNMNHPAFKFTTMIDIRSRWKFKNVFTTYRVFLILPALLLIHSGFYTYLYVKESKWSDTKSTMTLIALWIIPIFMVILVFGVLTLGNTFVRSDIKSINTVNEQILSHLYNSSEFNVLSQPDVDRLQQIKTYQTLLNNVLASAPTTEEFAKALFTINLYLTYYEIGSRHKNVQDALNMFNTTTRLSNNNFADYLSPKTIYIRDRIGEILANIRDADVDRPMRLEAKALASKWVSDLNSTLGNISYSSAFLAFIVVTIGLALIAIGIVKAVPILLAFN